jgi:hypothetical protein
MLKWPLQLIEMMTEKFLDHCQACPFEPPKSPVKKHELGPPPGHNCPNEGRLNLDEIMDWQGRF